MLLLKLLTKPRKKLGHSKSNKQLVKIIYFKFRSLLKIKN